VYVLDPMLQDGKKVPKWLPRARRGLYVGVSQRHSTTVGRVLNLNTGHISDQYHCVYDDTFSTVSCPFGNPFDVDTFSDETWQRILESGYERHVNVELDDRGRPLPLFELADDWLSGPERLLQARLQWNAQSVACNTFETTQRHKLRGSLVFRGSIRFLRSPILNPHLYYQDAPSAVGDDFADFQRLQPHRLVSRGIKVKMK
jgi:hypothetical protein